jgi:phage-related protein
MHQNIEDVSAALGILAQAGIRGSSAGTALKNMFLGLEPRTKKAAQLFDDLGLTTKEGESVFFDLKGTLLPLPDIIDKLNEKFGGLTDANKQAALSTAFTKYGLAGLETIVEQNRDSFVKYKEELKSMDAAAQAKTRMDNLEGSIELLKGSFETFMTKAGTPFLNGIRKVVDTLNVIVDKFTNLPQPIQKGIMIFSAVTGVLAIVAGTILSVSVAIGMAIPGFEMLGAIFGAVAAPLGIAIGIFAALGIAVYELYKHWDTVRAWVQLHFGVTLPGTFQEFKTVFLSIWSSISSGFSLALEKIKAIGTSAFNYVEPFILGALNRVKQFWADHGAQIKQLIDIFWQWAKPFVEFAIKVIVSGISFWLGFIQGAWRDAWHYCKDVIKFVFDRVVDTLRIFWDLVSGIIGIGLDLITGDWSKAWTDCKNMVVNLFNDIKTFLKNTVGDLVNIGYDLIMGLVHGVEKGFEKLKSAWGKVTDLMGTKTNAYNSYFNEDGTPNGYASGGVITKPELAWVGEGGETEYIVPHSKVPAFIAANASKAGFGGSGGGHTFNVSINVSGGNGNNRDLANSIASAFRQQMSFAING